MTPYASLMPSAAWCRESAVRAMLPRLPLSVSEWADTHRELTSKQSGERGRWRTARTPYLREIMDCLSSHSPVRDIVIMKSSQVGVTEAVINFLGYVIDHAPAPTMVLMPTLELRDAWKVQKLNPLLTDTPAVRDILGGLRSRDAANRQDVIDFPGGILFLAGGNSANSYAQRSVRNLVLDDLDRFPTEVGEEGDPVSLARGRTKSFPRAKRVFISTPTTKGNLIDREWARSDQRQWHMPCPHCGTLAPLQWSETLYLGQFHGGMIKHSENLDAAWYVCGTCAATISEHEKARMLPQGRWIAAQPERATRGYHLSALFGAIGLAPGWLELAREFADACHAPSTYRTFVNTQLGLPYEEQGDGVEPVGLLSRLEEYPDPLPDIRARTAGVDVQKDRLEATIVDWSDGERAWVRDHLIVPGDTAQPDVWAALLEELTALGVNAGAIDSGFNTSMVYAFVERNPWASAIKGMPGPGRPLTEDERIRRQRLRRQRKRGVLVEPIGVDQGKALVYSRLRMTKVGPGYISFPREPAFDDEYFAQLTAEKLVTKMRGTRPYTEWVQTRPRNEALDCLIYALAALRLPMRSTTVITKRFVRGRLQ